MNVSGDGIANVTPDQTVQALCFHPASVLSLVHRCNAVLLQLERLVLVHPLPTICNGYAPFLNLENSC